MPGRKNRVQSIFAPPALTFTTLCAALVTGCGGGGGGSPPASAPSQVGHAAASSEPDRSGAVTLNWIPPTEKIDGSPLTNLGGYRIYWGTKRGNYPNSVTIDNPALATYVITALAPARWYFVVAAFTTDGLEGERSDVFTETVQ
jgi:hypothetical protein